VAVFTIATSALFALATTTVALAVFVVMLGTTLPAVAESVSVMLVPDGVPAFTCNTRLKVTVFTAPTPRLPLSVQVMVPVPPTGGTVPQVHPAGGVIDWKVVFGGVICVKVIPAVAATGPLFVTVCVYVMLLPAATELGEAELVTTRSACVARATTSAAVALLLAALGSVVEVPTVTVSFTAVPAAVPAVTLTTTGKLAVPGAKLGFVQLIVPALPTVGRVHDHPTGTVVSEKNVVLGGVFSVNVALVAGLGPAFVTTCAYVMLLPASTGTGLPTFVTERFAESATCTLALALLLVELGSVVGDALTESVPVMVVPEAVPAFTLTVKVKVALALAARLAMVQV
jgi:hypothetical protein